MINIILDFLRTGRLEFLQLGMTFEEVSNLLGHPEPIRTSNRRLVFELEDLTVGFHRRKLDVISIKIKNSKLHLPKEIFEQEIDCEEWKKYEHFVQMLDRNNIKYSFRPGKNHQGIQWMSCIKLENDISVFFDGDDLYSISAM